MESIAGSPSKNAVMQQRLANLRELLPTTSTWKDAPQAVREIIENARVQGGGGKKDWVSEEIQAGIKDAFEVLRKVVVKLKEQLEVQDEDVTKSTELACRALRLTKRAADRYAAAKQAQGVLDFDDLLLRARDLLRDNKHVRKRVADGIRLLMVDEFQDTDPVQAEVVRSLCGAALTRGKLFMVGDRKQSIYRFRRADPTVFATMSDELPPSGRLPLNVNFRSQPAILNFVNHLFAPAMDGYEPLVPFQNDQLSPTPAIEFLFATFEADQSDDGDPSSPDTHHSVPATHSDVDDDDSPNAAALRGREADWIARRIASLLADPVKRIRTKKQDANGRVLLRRVEPRDIVILFRALSSVQDYESALRRYGLDYYLVGGKAFFAQQEVFDLLNLCRYLDDCDDLVGLAGLLRSPFFNLSDDAIHALAFHSEPAPTGDDSRSLVAERRTGAMSLHQTLYFEPPTILSDDQRSRIRFAAEVLTDLRIRKDRIPLSDLLTEAVERTGYDASVLAEFLGSRKLANLRKLIEMARQFDRGDFFTLKDFVTRLQTSVLEETDEEFATTLPESGDVVRLMSIHQSKGLEFPVVMVADIDRKGPPRSGDAVMHPELGPLIKPPEKFGKRAENLGLKMHGLVEDEADAQETIRLFYVACTRAADYLILSAGLDPDKPKQSPWLKLVESRFHLQTGLLKGDPLLGSSASGTAGPENIPEILSHHQPCKAKRAESDHDRRIPLGELPRRVIEAESGEFPASARIFPRDSSDLSVISVSHLESIDAELTGTTHGHRPGDPVSDDDISVDPDQATALGTVLHAVLERVDFRDTSNWAELLTDAIRQSADPFSDEAIQRARTMLARFFSSPIAAELTSARSIHREIDFLLPWPSSSTPDTKQGVATPASRPSVLVAGIIDLLIETDSGWSVLDYKTGDFSMQSPDEQHLAPYELQLGLYAHAVEQWFGNAPRELSLIVFRPQIRRITLSWSETRWALIRSRIDRAMNFIRSVD